MLIVLGILMMLVFYILELYLTALGETMAETRRAAIALNRKPRVITEEDLEWDN